MSMSPLNGLVLGAAAVVASPALWLTMVEGTLPLTDALLRYLLSVLICWAALNVVAMLAFPDAAPATPTPVREEAADQSGAQQVALDVEQPTSV